MGQVKKFLLGEEARGKMLEGAKIVYDIVSPTSGPKGRNAAYARPYGLPRIINDGIEIAKEVGCEDEFASVGIDLIREAAQNTVTDAGDGTTTSIILAYHILKQSIAAINDGENPMVIRTQILDCLASLLAYVPKLSTKITSEEELYKVALISASGDTEIAKEVSHTVWEMGADGIVTCEEGNGLSITSEVTKGMQLAKGYLDPMLITDDMRMESVIINPKILVIEKVITVGTEIAAIMNEIAKQYKDIVIFGDIRGDALETIKLNKMRGTFQLLAVNPPGYQDQRLAVLQDIAILTGATVVTSATQSWHNSYLGTASHIISNKSTTTIASGGGNKEVVDKRASEIRTKIEEGETTLYEREKLEERLSKLTAGVALIKVGAKSETAKREKFEKVKDAIGATKAALQEGIVVGGGMAFIELSRQIESFENVGNAIMFDALLTPTIKLLENAGKTEDEVKRIMVKKELQDKNHGYNVNTDKIEDLMKAGVVDPARVIRLSLENAVIVATSMFTAESLIVPVMDKPQN